MFCSNCGKQIMETARFCNYCGAKIVNFDENPVKNSAEISENPISIPAEDVKIPENVENPVDLLRTQGDVSSSAEQMNEPPEKGDTPFTETEAKETNDTDDMTETPSSEIQSGMIGAQHRTDVSPMPEPSDTRFDVNIPRSEPISRPLAQSEQISASPEKSGQSERRYTLGHIIMCLVSTAVMAIVAGVFAGLYFSVV